MLNEMLTRVNLSRDTTPRTNQTTPEIVVSNSNTTSEDTSVSDNMKSMFNFMKKFQKISDEEYTDLGTKQMKSEGTQTEAKQTDNINKTTSPNRTSRQASEEGKATPLDFGSFINRLRNNSDDDIVDYRYRLQYKYYDHIFEK